jgi:hypothetical protein
MNTRARFFIVLLLSLSTSAMSAVSSHAERAERSAAAKLVSFEAWSELKTVCGQESAVNVGDTMCGPGGQLTQIAATRMECVSATMDLGRGIGEPIQGKVSKKDTRCVAGFDQLPSDARGIVRIEVRRTGLVEASPDEPKSFVASACLAINGTKSVQLTFVPKERETRFNESGGPPCELTAGTATVEINGKLKQRNDVPIGCGEVKAEWVSRSGLGGVGKLTRLTPSRDRCFFNLIEVPMGEPVKINLSGAIDTILIGKKLLQVFGEGELTFNLRPPESDDTNSIEMLVQQAAAPSAPAQLSDTSDFVSSTGAQEVNPGATLRLSIVIKNSGQMTWTPGTHGYRSYGPWAAKWGSKSIWRDVPPGDTLAFEDDVVVPDAPGVYDYGFRLTKAGKDASIDYNLKITVKDVARVDAVEVTEQPAEQTLTTGERATLRFVFRNAGNRAWRKSEIYRFVYEGWPRGTQTLGNTLLPKDIQPGETVERSVVFVAPSSAGVYDLKLTITRAGQAIGPGAIVRVNVQPRGSSVSLGNLSGFETWGKWIVGDQKLSGVFVQSDEQAHAGKFSGKFEYSLPAAPDNFFVFRLASPMSLGKAARGLQLWVYGNGTPTYLNAWVRDAENRIWQFTFGQTTHTGWQQMNAPFDITRGWPNVTVGSDAKQQLISPLSLYGFSVDVPDDQSITNFFYIDDLSVSSTPLSAGPANMPALPQPTTVPAVQLPLPGVSPAIAFDADRTSINAGECVNLKWNVTEVNGVWLNGQGVPGQSNQQVCPGQTQTYTLKIQKRDGTFEERSITIQVSGNAQPPAANLPPVAVPAPADTGYGTLGVVAADAHRPAEGNPDLNLSLLGYQPNGAAPAYKDYGPADDPLAPQLRGLFGDRRQPTFTTAFINNGWDWNSNTPTPPTPSPYEVAVIGIAVTPGETLFAPGSGRSIGNDYAALVLYADSNQITLKYTPEDSIARGYTVFIEGVNVNPQLLAVYQSTNGAGRSSLPALRAGQLFGTAHGGEIRVAIRDNATFMDPRSLQDWWR